MSKLSKILKMKITHNEYLTAPKVAKMFGVSEWSIYEAIRSDPSFPFHNVGPKKNYRINPNEFKKWLNDRTARTKYHLTRIKSVDELLRGHNARI